MAAPTTTSARAPEVEQSHTSLNEPSMEDILASIRRIIAEDQSNSLGRTGLGGLSRRSQPPAVAPVLDEAPAAQLEVAPAVEASFEIEAHASLQVDAGQHAYEHHFDEPLATVDEPVVEQHLLAEPPAEVYEMPAARAEPSFEPVFHAAEEPQAEQAGLRTEEESGPLMSPSTGASITSSFQTLAESVMLQDPGLIERVMRESMRPLLKAWLDDHLPSIVERLVRSEIERVARGGHSRNT